MTVDIKVAFALLIPEETFQPVLFSAKLLTISEDGALVEVALDEHSYRALLNTTRYCRLKIVNQPELPPKLICKAVWIQPEARAEGTIYKIGLMFEELEEDSAAHLRAYIERLMKEQGVVPDKTSPL